MGRGEKDPYLRKEVGKRRDNQGGGSIMRHKVRQKVEGGHTLRKGSWFRGDYEKKQRKKVN